MTANLRVATDAAFALGVAKVMIDEKLYKAAYVKEQTDLPMLVRLVSTDGRLVPERFVRASDFDGALGVIKQARLKLITR